MTNPAIEKNTIANLLSVESSDSVHAVDYVVKFIVFNPIPVQTWIKASINDTGSQETCISQKLIDLFGIAVSGKNKLSLEGMNI